MLSELSHSHRVAGYKQTIKAIKKGLAVKVYLAEDIDPAIYEAVLKAAEDKGIPVEKTVMNDLGKACGINVPTAAAAQISE